MRVLMDRKVEECHFENLDALVLELLGQPAAGAGARNHQKCCSFLNRKGSEYMSIAGNT
jgi:hypothetical protein